MIANRVARRFVVALASAFLVAASDVAGQDALTRAKDLYASAAYDDALAVLDQLKLDSSSPDVVEAGQYRAFCLLALGRSDEGRKAIAGIIEADPLFQPAETQMSPRLVTVFRDVRKQLLPRIVQQSYAEAKVAFDRKELEAAAIGFDRVLLLLNDPDLPASSGTTDLRMLATGFRDLSRVAPPPPPPKAASPPAPSAPPNGRPAEAPGPPRTYGPNDADVTPPVVVSQQLPPWRPSKLSATRRDYQGAVALVIDERGNVESVALLTSLQPEYNSVLLKAAREWKFRPATKDGLPVRYRKVVGIRLSPSE
jgi:tetratricopeptide (TPR) repeat protein